MIKEQTRQDTALKEIVLAGGALGFNWLPVYVAERQGIFARHGLKVSLKRTGSVEKATSAVKAGGADLAITPPEGAISDTVAGGSLFILAGNVNRLPLTLIANPRFKTIEELRGKRLGTSSMTEGTAIYTREMLSRHGLNYPGDYEFSVVGVHPARWKALQEGTIDAAVQLAPLNFIGVDAGYTDLGEVSDYIPHIAFTALIGDRDWARSHRSEVLALLASLREATELLYDASNDATIARPIVMEVVQTDEIYAQRSLDYMRGKAVFARSLEIPQGAFATTLDLMIKAGLLKASQRDLAAATFDDSFINA
ncbi:ABC transporter substrate-binding protein [Mesorhizobium delmotii]|uniref:ABC transporter substrate-binding protein n=1 Tax=Mesorhizobium delmotii TaxID=1631247 RepID=A0A2P9ADZ8_9HYPH|nr:ABC transporter substrate-binding protein [Mesorhizobium delmotii]SJM29354.1 ABC transporter substrate-binding protein [Mesorhizobium delmotii]